MTDSKIPLGPRTTALLDRLRRIDPAAGDVNRCRAARAVALHLERLGLPARPPSWTDDGPSFMGEILSAGWKLHLQASADPGPLKVVHRSQFLVRLHPRVQNETRDPAYQAALGLLWRPQACHHGEPPRQPTPAEAAGREAFTALQNLPAFGEYGARWATAADAARRLLRSAGIPEEGPDHAHALQALTQIGATLDPNPAGLAGRYLSDLAAAESLGVAETLGALEPMVDALEAGLWFFWPTATEILLVARPAMRFKGCDPHDEKGPAVSWSGGPSYWMLFGQPVDREVVEAPATLDPARIEREPHPFQRGILIRQYGLERYLRDAGGTIAAESSAGRLIHFGSFALVEVRRPSSPFPPEYVRVPVAVATPEEGLAWTFGLTAAEYGRDKGPYRELYAPNEMGPEARALLDRLRKVDRRHPVVDREKAKAAFARRFPSVDGRKIEVRWLTAREALQIHGEHFCFGHSLGDQEPYAESLGEANHSADLACDQNAEGEAFDALDAFHAQIVVSQMACTAVGIAGSRHLGRISLSDDDFARFWLPWIELYEAGAGLLWTSPNSIQVLQRPAMRVVAGVLHDDDAPAVSWPEGPEFRYRRGVRLKK